MSTVIVQVPTWPGVSVIVAEAGTNVLNQLTLSSHVRVTLAVPVFFVITWKLNGAWFSMAVSVTVVGVAVNSAHDSAGKNSSPAHRQAY